MAKKPPADPPAKSAAQMLHELANHLQPVAMSMWHDREYALVVPSVLKEARAALHKIADEMDNAKTET